MYVKYLRCFVLGLGLCAVQVGAQAELSYPAARHALQQIQSDPEQLEAYLQTAARRPDYRDTLSPGERERLLAASEQSADAFAEALRAQLKERPETFLSVYDGLTPWLPAVRRKQLLALIGGLVDEGRILVEGDRLVYRPGTLWKKVLIGGGVAGAVGAAAGGGGGGGGSSSSAEPAPEPEPQPEAFEPPHFPVSHAYSADYRHEMVGTELAHDRTYDGTNVIIGILDTGFRATHQELDGQFDSFYNAITGASGAAASVDPHGHGTHVAGIIAAKRNATDVTGVAPGARLVGIRIGDDSGDLTANDGQLASGVDFAVAAGSDVVNNSWGFQTPVNQISAQTIEGNFPVLLQAYRDAATADRIMVFSNGNKRQDYPEEPMVLAGLPALFSELADHWVAVGAVGPDGILASYSQPCGSAAAWCLVAPGGDDGEYIISAYHTGDDHYAGMMGTSMAAPMVTGALAVLKERFPTLTNAVIVDRLFLTANKEGVYADSALYGQGLLDLDKATDPVGPLSVVDPETSTSGGSDELNLAETQMVLSAAWGDELIQAISGTRVAVADSQGAGFFVDLGALTRSRYRLDAAQALDRYHNASSWQSLELGRGGLLHLSFGAGESAGALNGFVHQLQMDTAVWRYGLVENMDLFAETSLEHLQGSYSAAVFDLPVFDRDARFWAASYGNQLSGLRWAATALVPQKDSEEVSSPRLGMLTVGFQPSEDLRFGLALGAGRERDGVMGSDFGGGFALEKDAPLALTHFNTAWQASETTALFASAYWGYARPEPGAGVISQLSPLVSSRFALGLGHRLDEQTSLGVMVSQPLRVESGEMELTVATGYEGNRFNRKRFQFDLEPQARQRDYEFFYRWQGQDSASFRASLVHQINPGHRRSASNSLLLISAERHF